MIGNLLCQGFFQWVGDMKYVSSLGNEGLCVTDMGTLFFLEDESNWETLILHKSK